MSAAKIFVPKDAAALSVGADQVAAAIEAEAKTRGVEIEIVRNGSRGMFWLEPLVEVVQPQGRVAYGPVTVEDVPTLFEAGFLDGNVHALFRGLTEEIPYLKEQERLTFARCGIVDPMSPEEYEAHGGNAGLKKALKMSGEEILQGRHRQRPPRPRRRGLPDRHQMEDRPRHAGRREVHRL